MESCKHALIVSNWISNKTMHTPMTSSSCLFKSRDSSHVWEKKLCEAWSRVELASKRSKIIHSKLKLEEKEIFRVLTITCKIDKLYCKSCWNRRKHRHVGEWERIHEKMNLRLVLMIQWIQWILLFTHIFFLRQQNRRKKKLLRGNWGPKMNFRNGMSLLHRLHRWFLWGADVEVNLQF